MEARRTLDGFSAAYAAISDDPALKPADRVSALNRLGMVRQHEGRLADRAELVRRALELKEGMLGPESTQLTHEVRRAANRPLGRRCVPPALTACGGLQSDEASIGWASAAD